MQRRLKLSLWLIPLALVAPQRVAAQFNVGAHAARAADVFGGAWGVGATVGVDVPALPVGARVGADYFRPDCGAADGCGYWGWTADVKVGVPFPFVRPYALGGVVRRRYDPGPGDATWDSGWAAGIGVDVGSLLLHAFGELRYEGVEPDHQIVFRLGVIF
jgi:hypothetical protein